VKDNPERRRWSLRAQNRKAER